MQLKYGNVRTFSKLIGNWFSSKGECKYGEELYYRQMAGEITDLRFHTRLVLSPPPDKVSIEVDFIYQENGKIVHEDFKGKETESYRVKRIWLKQLTGIEVILVRR